MTSFLEIYIVRYVQKRGYDWAEAEPRQFAFSYSAYDYNIMS